MQEEQKSTISQEGSIQDYIIVDTPGKIRALNLVKFIVVASLLALLTYALAYEIPTQLYLKNALKGKFEYININELKSNNKQKNNNQKKIKKEKQQKNKKKVG
jgi:hypothetical protein